MPSIAIIGGGMAGLAAAATLSRHGQQVTLFEAGATLGGRARGFYYNGLQLDNGQHLLLGAYQQTRQLLQLVGVTESAVLTRLPMQLHIKDLMGKHHFTLSSNPALAAPWSILWGLMTAQGIGFVERWQAVRWLVWMRLHHFTLQHDQSLMSLLMTHQQSPAMIKWLWEPLCLAALNTPLEQASAQVFLNVLRDSFAKNKQDADFLIAKTDLSSLISTPIAQYLGSNNSQVNIKTAIETIQPTTQGYTLVTNDAEYAFEAIILACGPHQLKKFAKTLPKLHRLTAHFSYQPITTVYLQYPAQTMLPKPMMGMVNSLSQWVFDRGQLCHQAGLMAVVISAHKPFTLTQNELAVVVAKELAALFPCLSNVIWHKVITEKRATFSCDVGLSRPENSSPYPHLWIVGDYTAGAYPATIEGAVRSGIQAANSVMAAR
ncbi:MAG: hydroxysqualene dehydroxylase HpnE [Methylophilaceae bacterium]|nr:hydroxysqualene dehydroxylase HpnE [Methylophilaceae bacterium]MDG1445678.1 hydroxysqualene dehydroxylase HpnE [Methylophilaceae bacterium]